MRVLGLAAAERCRDDLPQDEKSSAWNRTPTLAAPVKSVEADRGKAVEALVSSQLDPAHRRCCTHVLGPQGVFSSVRRIRTNRNRNETEIPEEFFDAMPDVMTDLPEGRGASEDRLAKRDEETFSSSSHMHEGGFCR